MTNGTPTVKQAAQLDNIEIHFFRYNNESEAREKWTRRKRRINKDRLVLIFTDRDLCTPELLAQFDALPYARKIAFTPQNYPELESCMTLPEFADQREIGDTYTNYHTISNLDFSALIDGTHARGTEGDHHLNWRPEHAV